MADRRGYWKSNSKRASREEGESGERGKSWKPGEEREGRGWVTHGFDTWMSVVVAGSWGGLQPSASPDICWKCTFSDPTPKPLNQKFGEGSPRIYALTNSLDDSGATEVWDAQIWSRRRNCR